MTAWETMEARHAVRAYTDRKIEGETLARLQQEIEDYNRFGRLRMQLCLDSPEAFRSLIARYGRFRNVGNYLALVGEDEPSLEERCGYYGEKIALLAQELGLNSCWVAGTYSKKKIVADIQGREKLLAVITLGYGENQGSPHKNRPMESLYTAPGTPPDWFLNGMKAVMLAPTAMNQQKFHFSLEGDAVEARPGRGFLTKMDLGIGKCHFEIGAGSGDWHWL